MRLYFMAEPNPTSHRGLLERPTPTFGALEEPPALWPPGRDQLGAAAFTRSRGARPSSPAKSDPRVSAVTPAARVTPTTNNCGAGLEERFRAHALRPARTGRNAGNREASER
jgi:hypothetical protein